MADRLSLAGLAATLVPARYLARYTENLAASLNTLSFPGESQTRTLEGSYVPLRFREIAAGGSATPGAASTKTTDIWDALFRSARLAIVGETGAGKTTTLRYVAVVLAQKMMPEAYVRRLTFLHHGRAFDQLLPIYADVGRLDLQADDLAKVLAQPFAEHGFPRATDFVRARLMGGGCLLLLDGLDAVPTPALREHLRDLLSRYPKLHMVSSSTKPVANVLPDLVCFEPLPFSEVEIAAFVDQRLGGDSSAATALLQAFERSSGLRSLAGNPFLLSVMAWVSDSSQVWPLQQQALYERCLQTLLDGSKAGLAPSQPALSQEARDRALQELAYYLHCQHQEWFSDEDLHANRETQQMLKETDLEASVLALKESGLFRQEGQQRAFLRLALQEYLAARAIAGTDRFAHILGNFVDDPWWRQVIVLAAALSGDAEPVIGKILASSRKPNEALLLAAQCATEAPATTEEVKNRLRDQLFAIFQNGDAAQWRAAAQCIAALEGQKISDYFSKALREGAVEERKRAALVMGRIGTPEWSTTPLLGVLDKSRPWEVRKQAAWALGQLGDKRAVPALMETLKDEREDVAGEAALSLSAIGEPAVPMLIASLSSDQPGVHRMAVKALGNMGTVAVRPLRAIVEDAKQADSAVRGAAEALGLLKDTESVPNLVALLHGRGGRIIESAARALAEMGEPAVQPLIDSLPEQGALLELRNALVSALVVIGKPSIEPLIQSLNSSSAAIRSAGEEALTRIGPPAVEALVRGLRSEHWDIRRRIAQILGRVGDEHLVEPLLPALSDEDPGVRGRVLQILGQVGGERAVDPLVEAMRHDPDDFVRRTAVKVLAELRNERAVIPLIQVLETPELRGIAINGLSEIGDAAVEPLIQAINEERDPEVRRAGIKCLSSIGTRGRLGEHTLAAVAQVYSTLFNQHPPLQDMITQLEYTQWWKPGEELWRAFGSAEALLKARSLTEVAQCPQTLQWVDALENPYRPGIKRVLWDLNDVAQSVHLYLSDTRREGQRDALLSALNSLVEIREKIDTQLLEFEKEPFLDIVEAWHQLMEDSIKLLRGRAQLEITLLRDDLPIDATSLSAMIVFRLTNVGDSAARNLTVTLKRGTKDGFEIVGDSTQRLDPLGTGMQRDVDFWIRPLGVTEAAFSFEVTYDDDESADHFYPSSGRVRFFALAQEYRPIPVSPYVMGPPVKTPHMFYGRQDVFDWVRENIGGIYQQNILILHGERRMGKTSILYQLHNRPPTPQHICVFFSLELAITTSLGDLFYDMAVAIHDEVTQCGMDLPQPSETEFMGNAQRCFRRFCDTLERILGDRRLLIMIDEVDILIAKVEENLLSGDVFNFIRGLMQHTNKIAFIFTGAHKVREMLKDSKSILFNIARSYKISYLNHNEGEALIVKPVEGYLTYDDLVVDKILRVSACHPYFIQYICDSLVKLAQRTQKNFVVLPDVDLVLQDIIQDNTGVLQSSVYASLGRPEQRVLAALANVTDDYRIYVLPEMVMQVLERHRLAIPNLDLLDALRSLCERDLVVEQRIGQSLQYGFKMGLIRMWIRQNEVLLRLGQEMKA